MTSSQVQNAQKAELLRPAISAGKTLSAGVLSSLVAGFLTNVGKLGWSAAVGMLNPATAGAVIAIAGVFGITQACENRKERKKAADLAGQFEKLTKVQGNTFDLLSKIADGEIGVTVDEFTKQEIAEAVAQALGDADLVKGVATDNFAAAGVADNADFVGRRAILDELHAGLQKSDVALTHDLPGVDRAAQALRGEGGIGKTQIAVRYAHEHADDYEARWWINASNAAIDASTASLATTLCISPGPKDTPEQICASIRRKLAGARHLLILDNLDNPDRLDDFLLPPPARVLITTRLRTLPITRVDELPISVFEPQESIALLRKHRNDLEGGEHDEALGRVADRLGNHALAVTLAAGYLRKRPAVSPIELLERLQRTDVGDKLNILEKLDPGEHTAGYRLSVAASLGLHLPDFADAPAMDLLGLAAFCHPDSIPVDLFSGALGLSKEAVEDWLVKLDDVSIIHYDGKTVSIHRLMQDVIRAEIGAEKQRETLTHLTGQLAERFKHALDYRNWSMQDAYAAHAETAVEHAERVGEIQRAGFLGHQVGFYFQNRVRFDAALAALRAAERIDRAAYGDDHPNVATTVNNIGAVLQDKADLDGALERFREAERIDRAAYGDNHPNVATTVNNIGGVLRAKGDLDGALTCFREAERIDRAAYGNDHPNVAACVNNIGGVLRDKGDLDGALECFREAERIDRAACGDDHPDVARCVNNIGAVLQDKGDLDGALDCFREAERISRAGYGDDHPNVATCVSNIGDVLRVKGDLDGALDCFREADRIDRAAYGDDHPEVAIDVSNIGSVLEAKGDREGARRMCSEAFRILLTTVGPRALNMVAFAENLTAVDLDPLALAREVAGDEVADQLREALLERREQK